MTCSKEGCPGQPTWIPMLMLSQEETGTKLPASLPDLGICESHKEVAKLDDFLSPEGWEKISKFLLAAGKGEFVKRSTKLGWQQSTDPDLLPF